VKCDTLIQKPILQLLRGLHTKSVARCSIGHISVASAVLSRLASNSVSILETVVQTKLWWCRNGTSLLFATIGNCTCRYHHCYWNRCASHVRRDYQSLKDTCRLSSIRRQTYSQRSIDLHLWHRYLDSAQQVESEPLYATGNIKVTGCENHEDVETCVGTIRENKDRAS
jgi:hypothetical protein